MIQANHASPRQPSERASGGAGKATACAVGRGLRTGSALACAIVAIALAVGAPAADAAKRKSACQKLRGGPDLAPARNVKLIKRRNPDFPGETMLLGCVLPRGRVHVVATSTESSTTTESYRVLSVGGPHVATRTSYHSQYGTSSGGAVTNLRTGVAYRLAGSSCGIEDTTCPPPAVVRRAFVTSDGRAAAAVTGGGITTIAAFSAAGARTQLDAGPSTAVRAGSLSLSYETVSWTGTGGARTAPLPPARPAGSHPRAIVST